MTDLGIKRKGVIIDNEVQPPAATPKRSRPRPKRSRPSPTTRKRSKRGKRG